MPEPRIRIGVFQISSHLAVTLGGCDLLQEPYLPPSPDQSLTTLARSRIELRDDLKNIKERYISWLSERLTLLMNWVTTRRDSPHIIVFPECSIPFECLPLLRNYSKSSGITFYAGTHTPRISDTASSTYKKAIGVPGSTVKSLSRATVPPVAVLPIVMPNETELHFKGTPSVFERTDFHPVVDDSSKVTPLYLPHLDLRIGALVCAEALQIIDFEPKLPDIVIITAFEREPMRFDKYIARYVDNKIPVVLANSALFGGSGVFTAHDTRTAEWWYQPPNNGKLPIGEAYLEIEINMESRAVERATSCPSAPFRIVQVAPLLIEGSALKGLEELASKHARTHDANALRAVRQEIDKSSSFTPLISRRWDYLETLAANEQLSDGVLEVLGEHISTPSLPSLEQLEQDLCAIAHDAVKRILDSDVVDVLSDEDLSAFHRVKRHDVKRIEKSTTGRPSPSQATRLAELPIGRNDILQNLRAFLASTSETIMILTGLEAIGKTTAIAAALQQSAAKVLEITCQPGATADFLYEFLLRASGRIPSGSAPRTSFALEDIQDALRPYDVIWLKDVHNLTEYGRWRNNAIEQLIGVVTEVHRRANTWILIESRRAVNIATPLGIQIGRKRLSGMPEQDAVSLLEQRLRRIDFPLEAISQDDRAEIVKLVDCHPGMIILCADVCNHSSAADVIRDLRGRRGFYLTAVQKLVTSLGLSKSEIQCLEALSLCREPISPQVLEAIVSADALGAVVAQLFDSCLIERTSLGKLSIGKLFREMHFEKQELTSSEIREIHTRASDDFHSIYKSGEQPAAYLAAIEANFHAALAGIHLPIDSTGLLDGVYAAAQSEYDAQRYLNVVRLLGPHVNDRTSEDVSAMLASAYSWTDNFDKCFILASSIVKKNRNFIWLFGEACNAALRSRRFEFAEQALTHAENLEPGSYRVALYKGRLCDRKGQREQAIDFYRDAASKTENDPWPYFYLARSCLQTGRPEEALEAVEGGRQITSRGTSRRSRGVENAFLQQELVALVLIGDYNAAKTILEVLESAKANRPEIVLCTAFVRAFFTKDKQQVLFVWESAIAKLDPSQTHRAHVRAQIHMLRGRLLENTDLHRAEQEYENAIRLDQHNVQMKVNLIKTLVKIAALSKDGDDLVAAKSAARRANEVAKDVLRYDGNQQDALYALQDIYHAYNIE